MEDGPFVHFPVEVERRVARGRTRGVDMYTLPCCNMPPLLPTDSRWNTTYQNTPWRNTPTACCSTAPAATVPTPHQHLPTTRRLYLPPSLPYLAAASLSLLRRHTTCHTHAPVPAPTHAAACVPVFLATRCRGHALLRTFTRRRCCSAATRAHLLHYRSPYYLLPPSDATVLPMKLTRLPG